MDLFLKGDTVHAGAAAEAEVAGRRRKGRAKGGQSCGNGARGLDLLPRHVLL